MNEVDSIRLKQCHQLKKHMPFSLTHKGDFSIVLPIKSKILLYRRVRYFLQNPGSKACVIMGKGNGE